MHRFPIVPHRWPPCRIALVGVLLVGALVVGCRSEAAALPAPVPAEGSDAPAGLGVDPPIAPTPVAAVASDRAALMAFYDATGGPDWEDNTNWGSTEPLESWHGVTVNARGRVVGLVLPDNALRGPLPAALGELTALEILDLSSRRGRDIHDDFVESDFDPYGGDNVLDGPIPTKWGRLLALRTLDLHGNDLSGPLPPELGNLTRLEVLDLHENYHLKSTIPPKWGDLTRLKVLDLSRCRIHGVLPHALGRLVNLEFLDLQWNELSGLMTPQLANLTNLERLDLSFNGLSGPFPAQWGDLGNLEYLDLSWNRLSGPIPPEWTNFPALEVLKLDGSNKLSGPIPPALGNLVNLRHLSLSGAGDGLSGPIPPALGNLANLQWLDLSSQQLSGPLPPTLENLTQLDYLDLSSNKLQGSLPPEWGNLVRLTYMNLNNNALSGLIPAEWATIGERSNLTPGFEATLRLGEQWLGDQYLGFDGCVPYALRHLNIQWAPDPCLLRDLTLSNAAMDPPFDPVMRTAIYTATVADEVDAVTVTASPYGEEIGLRIYHLSQDGQGTFAEDPQVYASGAAVPLGQGTNLIIVQLAEREEERSTEGYQRIYVVVPRPGADPPPAAEMIPSWEAVTDALDRIRAAAEAN